MKSHVLAYQHSALSNPYWSKGEREMPDRENDDLTQSTQRYAEGAEKTERDWIES